MSPASIGLLYGKSAILALEPRRSLKALSVGLSFSLLTALQGQDYGQENKYYTCIITKNKRLPGLFILFWELSCRFKAGERKLQIFNWLLRTWGGG